MIFKKHIKAILLHKAFQNFAIIGSIAVLQVAVNVILGRKLSKEEFGIYSFVFQNVIRFISLFLLFGQANSIIRYFSSKSINDYKWKKYIIVLFIIVMIPLVISSFFIKSYYKLEFIWFIFIVIGSALRWVSMVAASIYRSKGMFNIAVLLDRAHPLIFFLMITIPASIAFFISDETTFGFVELFNFIVSYKINIINISIFKSLSMVMALLFLIYIIIKWKQGTKPVESNLYKDGLRLWELDLAIMILYSVDPLLIPLVMNMEAVALYNVILSVLQIYEFGFTSLYNYYSQKFSESRNINISKIFKMLIALSILFALFYIFSTNIILDFLFNGKYQAPISLVALFCIFGTLNITYVLPSCYMIGHSDKSDMKVMFYVNIISLTLKLVFVFVLKGFGLHGFVAAGIIALGFRSLGGYYLVVRRYFRDKLKKTI